MNNEELMAKARAAKSPEELLRLAHENGMPEFTEENAKVYFEALHHSGELSDEEMDVSAGGCAVRSHGQKMVSALNTCSRYRCGPCNGNTHYNRLPSYPDESLLRECNPRLYDPNSEYGHITYCGGCYYCTYERGAWWCNNANHYNE